MRGKWGGPSTLLLWVAFLLAAGIMVVKFL